MMIYFKDETNFRTNLFLEILPNIRQGEWNHYVYKTYILGVSKGYLFYL